MDPEAVRPSIACCFAVENLIPKLCSAHAHVALAVATNLHISLQRERSQVQVIILLTVPSMTNHFRTQSMASPLATPMLTS